MSGARRWARVCAYEHSSLRPACGFDSNAYVTRSVVPNDEMNPALSYDSLHLNDDGYAVWANTLADCMRGTKCS